MKSNIYFMAWVFFLILLLTGCQKEKTESRDYPQIRTSPVDQITSEGARFNANITSGNSESISEYGFVWGEYDNLNIQNSEKATMEGAPETDQYSHEHQFRPGGYEGIFCQSLCKIRRFSDLWGSC